MTGQSARAASGVGGRERSSVVLAGVLLLASFVDGVSDNWVHAAVLTGAAVGLWWDNGRRAARQPALLERKPGPRTGVWLGFVALAYAVAAGALHPYTWPVTLAVVIPGTTAIVLSWRGPLFPRPVPPAIGARGVVWWGVVFVAGALWELAALLQQPSIQVGSYAHPTVSFLMDSVLASWAGRSLTLALWLGLGWALMSSATREGE